MPGITTSIRISPQLLSQIKRHAARRFTSVSRLIETLIRRAIRKGLLNP